MSRLITNWAGLPIVLAIAAVANLVPVAAQAQITLLNTWGSAGIGNGQFQLPVGVAVGPTGTVYVVDSDRVQVFNSSGTYQSTIGTGISGSGNNQFASPVGVAVSPTGMVYVADSGNNRVQVFNSSGVYQSTINNNMELDSPEGVAVGPTGVVYVADTNNQRVQAFDSSGVYQRTFGTTDSFGSGNNQFNAPTGVAAGPTDLVYVADNINSRVQIFNLSGTYQGTIGTTDSPGPGDNQFGEPTGVTVSQTGVVYVVDHVYNRVKVFNSVGVYQSTIGTGIQGSGNDQFANPVGVAVSPTGMVYVSDTFNNRIVRYFDPSSWGSGTNFFTDPTSGPTSLTVGTGQILGSSLTLNSSMGLIVGNTLTVASAGSLTQAGGTLTSTTFNISGAFNYQGGIFFAAATNLYSGGSFAATSFTIAAGTSLTQSGGSFAINNLTVGGNYNYSGGTFATPSSITVSPGGSFNASTLSLTVNNGQSLAVAGGPISIGSITAASGGIFQATQGGALTAAQPTYIAGEMVLDGGTSLSSTYMASQSGGLLAVGTATVAASSEIIIASGGEVQLSNSLFSVLTSPSLYNAGLLDGSGRINAQVQNYGEVNVASGQSLTIASAATNFSGGLFSLTGGTLHFTQTLTNQAGAHINGYGTLRVDGGLTNNNSAFISLGGAQPANVFGTINNENGRLSLAGSAYIFGTVNNDVATLPISFTVRSSTVKRRSLTLMPARSDCSTGA
jgi:sugar lactone lactonase YvrE